MAKTKLTLVPVYEDDIKADAGMELSVLCLGCKHFGKLPITCLAYPEGIPEKILNGEIDHLEVFEDQKGNFVYEQK